MGNCPKLTIEFSLSIEKILAFFSCFYPFLQKPFQFLLWKNPHTSPFKKEKDKNPHTSIYAYDHVQAYRYGI